jgi:PTH2 family peptidyl-tRNA hydrolase
MLIGKYINNFKELNIMDPKQVIILRTDTEPKMRKGKLVAQGAHASTAVILELLFGEYGSRTWEVDGKKSVVKAKVEIDMNTPFYQWISRIFKKVVVGGSLSEIIEAYKKAKSAGIPCSLIEDKGLTEFGGKITITACAIGPDDPDKIDKITGHLSLL